MKKLIFIILLLLILLFGCTENTENKIENDFDDYQNDNDNLANDFNDSTLNDLDDLSSNDLDSEEKINDELDIINLKIDFYCYKFQANPELNCNISQSEISNYLLEVNKIWEQANIKWELNSFQNKTIASQELNTLSGNETIQQMQQALFRIAPVNPQSDKIWNVILINSFPSPASGAGGLYFPGKGAIYFNHNREPKLLAHELGHGLSLWDLSEDEVNQFPTNLMGRGLRNTQNPSLNEDQINYSREQALKGPATREEMRGINRIE